MKKNYLAPTIKVKAMNTESLMNIVSVPNKDSGLEVVQEPGKGGEVLSKPGVWGGTDDDAQQGNNAWE